MAMHLCAMGQSPDATTAVHGAYEGQNTTVMRLVKTDLRGLNASDVLNKARIVLTSMQGNPHFPNPTPSLAEFATACDLLEESVVGTVDGGSRLEFVQKNTRMAEVKRMLTALAGYVGAIAGNNSEIVLSGGFEMRRPATRITRLEAPRELRAVTGQQYRSIYLRWRPVHGARMYRVYITRTPVDEASWELLALTSGSRCTATDLQAFAYYYFRVEAIGAHATSPMSDHASGLSIGLAAA